MRASCQRPGDPAFPLMPFMMARTTDFSTRDCGVKSRSEVLSAEHRKLKSFVALNKVACRGRSKYHTTTGLHLGIDYCVRDYHVSRISSIKQMSIEYKVKPRLFSRQIDQATTSIHKDRSGLSVRSSRRSPSTTLVIDGPDT